MPLVVWQRLDSAHWEGVLKDLTEQEKYDVILERNALLYADPKHDITKRVTELLNAKKGSAGG